MIYMYILLIAITLISFLIYPTSWKKEAVFSIIIVMTTVLTDVITFSLRDKFVFFPVFSALTLQFFIVMILAACVIEDPSLDDSLTKGMYYAYAVSFCITMGAIAYAI